MQHIHQYEKKQNHKAGRCLSVIGLVCLLAVFSLLQPAYAAKAETTLSIPEVQEEPYQHINTYLQQAVKAAHIPAMSVQIVDQDDILFSGNYGQCQSNDTPFFLGSVSKSFTAVCIMQLAEQQKLDLNATLSTYLPHATDGAQITVSQLLNHTSGLGEHQTLKDYHIVNPQGVHHYANVNYSLLGEIIETVSGKSYAAYITENLFVPLRLSLTAATLDESQANGLIDGYTDYWGVPIKKAHAYPTDKAAWITVPAGYLSSSTSDLGKYLQMYLQDGGDILTKESIQTMLYEDAVYVAGDIPFWYGYGWAMVQEPFPEPVLRHSGLIETGTSCVFILPESGIAIAITANVNDYFVANDMMDSLGWGIVQLLLGQQPNEIANHAYLLHHLWIDAIMLLVFLIAILPLCFLRQYAGRIRLRDLRTSVLWLVPLHFLLPIFILLLVPVFFATPLWVAKAFVPDVFLTVVVSSALLLLGGLIKGIMLYRYRLMRNACNSFVPKG